jgi:predicted DNA-binding ArsR family transcriptional regulator
MDKRTIAPKLGLDAEKRFELECISRGFNCYRSIVESGQVDYVIESNSKLYRIQIKSSDSDEERNPVKCSWGQARNVWKSYNKTIVDLLAVYLRKKDIWYIIPVQEVEENIGITISKDGKYEKYKNNWDLNSDVITNIKEETTTKEIIQLRENGDSVPKIAFTLGKSQTYIHRVLRIVGLGIKNKLAQATEETLRDLYINKKFSMEEIADSLNISTWYIRKMFRKFNIQLRINRNPYGIRGKSK